ncbi:MAG: Eco57I restriction-modification methylase domain-containing protein [Phycisphaerales bacterium]|nr:Eco57I restriction-modification methylase domain-containing protein [Phycisphaerales bacterium]
MAVTKRVVLESLTKPALVDLAREAGIAVSGLHKPDLVDALAGARSVRTEDILGGLSREELKALCRHAGLDDSGRAKQGIIDRLLGGRALAPPESTGHSGSHSPVSSPGPSRVVTPAASGDHALEAAQNMLDRDLQVVDITRLTSADALAAFLHNLGYPTNQRATLSPEGIGLPSGGPTIRQMDLLSEDADGFLQVIFIQLHSVTAKARADLVRAFGKGSVADRLLILTSDFDTLEFVLIEKEAGTAASKGKSPTTKLRSRVFVVPRRWPQQMLRIVRRLTYTMDDGLRQYDKLRGVFDAAHFSGTYFINRALFSDHYLETRLKDDPGWSAISPGPAFESVRRFLDTRNELQAQPLATVCQEFYDPLWSVLGFRAKRVDHRPGEVAADYELRDSEDERRSAALVYPWGRWLDGPDPNDPDRPTENPGSEVVSLLESGVADWVIVTNGQLWRLYSKAAHSRSTNFYEVDLPDVLIASGLSDPNEAFRYWWLFFRVQAFLPTEGDGEKCWLDTVVQGSREYAAEVEEELKRRVFYDVVPALAHGFLHDRRTRLGRRAQPSDTELEQIRQGTLTLLYRLLFLLYAESRDLLPVREAEYYRLSLKSLKEEVAAKAGVAESESDGKLTLEFRKSSTAIYDRLADPEQGLFAALANGRPAANVPRYNGGLFRLDPQEASDDHERDIAEFLNTHKVPDSFLAAAIDRLARVEDSRTYQLAFVDYKSLGVRQLGSIYEGLLEFKLRIAEEDLAVTDRKKLGDWISLDRSRSGSRRRTVREVHKGDPYLVRDKSERKATGSYYTPDHIVEYIVENTVGPVLKRKTEALRTKLREAEKAYHRQLDNARANPTALLGHPAGEAWRTRRKADPTAKPTEADFRAYAAHQAFHENDDHKKLVEELFDLKVLDPAMGSGHFLVEAVDFITDELLHFLNAFPVNPVALALDRTREAILASLREQGIETDEFLRRQLTDIHLLKRHVLKRCIYGVDLNPLATELAKVSLWLDAFTLGAPLSFLDHHLRTGNSLIGSSITELETPVQGQLFKIDESHLTRAVKSVLEVARLADSTAGEVAESKRLFEQARKTLASYRILLDILVARHFGLGDAASAIMEMAPQLDFRSIDAFRASFKQALATTKLPETELTKFFRQVGYERERGVRPDALEAVEALAAVRRFFHWDLEFPEVFYDFNGLADAQIHRKRLGEAGFDAIVGNPPYVRQETIKADKVFFAANYAPIFAAANDLFVYFMFREVELLKTSPNGAAHGLMGMIVANKWLRAVYAKKLRVFLARTARPISLIDFGHARVFPDADTFPCVPIFAHRTASIDSRSPMPVGESVFAGQLPREVYDPNQRIVEQLAPRMFALDVGLLHDDGWILEDLEVHNLLSCIRSRGQRLGDMTGVRVLSGVKTGFNQAFIVDAETKARLVASNPPCDALLMPLLRGRDVARWNTTGNAYLIALWSSENVPWPWASAGESAWRIFRAEYPALADWMAQHQTALQKRQDQGRYWWELRSCDYIASFGETKCVVQCIGYHSAWAWDESGSAINNKAYMVCGIDQWVVGLLNSRVVWSLMWRDFPHMKDEAISVDGNCIADLPIPDIDERQKSAITQVTHECRRLSRLLDDAGMSDNERTECMGALLEHEEDLDELASMAYGLTREQRLLLARTRPVRDPLDVLGSQING